jgi:hypothetical protein
MGTYLWSSHVKLSLSKKTNSQKGNKEWGSSKVYLKDPIRKSRI